MNKRIAYVTDTHLDESFILEKGVDPSKNWQLILNDITDKGIEEVVFGGDIGETASYEWFFDSVQSKKLDFKITLGNHDKMEDVLPFLPNLAEQPQYGFYYQREDEFYKYLFLDSSTDSINSGQINWLRQALSTEKKILLFLHHPVLEVGTIMDKKYPLHNRDVIKDLLLQHFSNVYIFCGHYHMKHEQSYQNIKQMITPACSYLIRKNPEKIEKCFTSFGYRIIHINPNAISTEVLFFEHDHFVKK